ncbi:hypothetical protein MP228_009448 [Amoeboaphelidium protococcarum]|nr:hypothetical protein MP228_009448 [Amoeboaphelidium protococcarum]
MPLKLAEKPYQSIKKIRKGKFEPRTSLLDSETLIRELNNFRGFFILFWIGIAITLLDNLYVHYKNGGRFTFKLYNLLSHDVVVLALSDLVITALSFFAPALHWLVHRRYIPIWLGTVLQHLYQALFLLGTIAFTVHRNFAWPGKTAICLHVCTLYMKMHSYLSYNQELEQVHRYVLKLKDDIGRGKRKADELEIHPKSPMTQRRSVEEQLASDEDGKASHRGSSQSSQSRRGGAVSLEQDLKNLADELTTGDTRYPANLTLENYVYFLCIPVLVYNLEYPRTEAIRWNYVFEKVVGFFGVFTILYLLVEHYISPVLENMAQLSLIETIGHLLMPFTLCWLLGFYMIFECLCNALAELTCFADRQFYEDWWNSTNYDEFARKWNKVVHDFLLRHIYLHSIDNYQISKTNASFITFLFSSCIHELLLAVVAGKVVMLFFFMQMSQLPIIYILRVSSFQKYPLAANAFFWLGLLSGLPLTAIFYTRDAFLNK